MRNSNANENSKQKHITIAALIQRAKPKIYTYIDLFSSSSLKEKS